jgi:hypothetical protein
MDNAMRLGSLTISAPFILRFVDHTGRLCDALAAGCAEKSNVVA